MLGNHHTSHCCVFHGCKYCEDDCPVVLGLENQEYSCEDCPDYYRLGNDVSCHIISMREMILIREGLQTFVAIPSTINYHLGEMMILDVESLDNLSEELAKYFKEYSVARVFQEQVKTEYSKFSLKLKVVTSSIFKVGDKSIVSIIEKNN